MFPVPAMSRRGYWRRVGLFWKIICGATVWNCIPVEVSVNGCTILIVEYVNVYVYQLLLLMNMPLMNGR